LYESITFYKEDVMDPLFSKTVKSGKTTYFVDVREAKNKSKYLTITESKLKDNAQEGEKKFIQKKLIIFDNSIEKLRTALDEAFNMINKA
jgi:hypothetical protein